MKLNAAPDGIPDALWLFSEDASRVLVSVDPTQAKALAGVVESRGVKARKVGATGGVSVGYGGLLDLGLEQVRPIYYHEPGTK